MTIVDAGVIIAHLDAADAHHAGACDALARSFSHEQDLVVPASALAECSVGAARRGDEAVEQLYRYLAEVPVSVAPLSPAVAATAASLRARFGSRLRLPDALVVATSIVEGATELLTTDRRWPDREALGLSAELVVI
ncbi:MAG: type II toxin-antitoxin system VapC family toxin [Acidimicrobiales bacterium]|nr:type II toxin-antitoxin system VapC family toxin [Acidimicrobiales bacterium]